MRQRRASARWPTTISAPSCSARGRCSAHRGGCATTWSSTRSPRTPSPIAGSSSTPAGGCGGRCCTSTTPSRPTSRPSRLLGIKVHNQVFNVLSENYRVLDLGYQVRHVLEQQKGIRLDLQVQQVGTSRSYRVDGSKFRETLGVECPAPDRRGGRRNLGRARRRDRVRQSRSTTTFAGSSCSATCIGG